LKKAITPEIGLQRFVTRHTAYRFTIGIQVCIHNSTFVH